MGQVIYFVEPESCSGRWHIKHSGRVRATYTSRAQAIMDLIGLAVLTGVDKRTTSTATYLAYELLEEAHDVIEAACSPKRKRAA